MDKDFNAWLADMSDKLRQKGKTLEEVLFDDSTALIKGKYRINTEAKTNYKAAIELVTKWFLQGKCFFRFKDINKPYYIHTICIRWRTKEDDVELEMSSLRELCNNLNDGLLIDDKGEWQLSTVIYTEDHS